MKILAYYLPQFHEVKENNEWWGDGFTEWTNVKNAKSLFKTHNQPRIPYNENYYDLSDVNTLSWQADLANEYGIYGMCFYHYWFENGKQLLEKPAELLLENKSISLNFCFSWANEPWTRSWDGKNGEVIMAQEYGDESDWIEHFNYLLPFFKDERYIKINNKPMFVMYKSSSMKLFPEMALLWKELALSNGFDGIYFVNTLRSKEKEQGEEHFSANVEFEPAYSVSNIPSFELNYRRILRFMNIYKNKLFRQNKVVNIPLDYQKITKLSLKKRPIDDKETFPGVFCDWDNTPRKKELGIYYKNSTPKLFYEYLCKKIELSHKHYHTDFLFVNAWNEWAEGTYLEPDKKNGFGYLEAIRDAQVVTKKG